MLYKRVLVKLSGEALMGSKQFGHDQNFIKNIALDIKQTHENNTQLCLVVGGGNIFRGSSAANVGLERTSADHVGMLATIMNALILQNALENLGLETRVLSAVPMETICESYIRRRAVRHMEKGRIVIFAAGTGNPFFSTDTAAVLRAVETGCEAVFKATQVNGVYSSDPLKNTDAKRYDKLNYNQVLNNDDIAVMDTAAIALAKENSLPIIVFSVQQQDALAQVTKGQGLFSTID